MPIIVPAAGPSPCSILLVGEAPGKEESIKLQPFVGRSGQEQESYLSRHNLTTRHWRRTNVIPEYTEGNPDPSPEQIERWTPCLLSEIYSCNPSLIIAVGRFSARWFLGDSTELETVHGLPHRPGAFDSSRVDRAPDGCVILPIYHPAFGFYDPDSRTLIAWDYSQVARIVSLIKSRRPVEFREDEWEGREIYLDVTGEELSLILSTTPDSHIGLDTEGYPEDPFSIQISNSPGSGYILRCDQPDFQLGISAIQSHVSNPAIDVVIHNAMFDLEMCRVMGLDLSESSIFDTMYAAYLTRIDAYQTGEGSRRRRSKQGLKPLAWRWCGMRMVSHDETVGVLGVERQLDYLNQVANGSWPEPDSTIVLSNDGTARLYRPQSIQKRARSIIKDVTSGKVNNKGELTDPWERWKKVDKSLRKPVESELSQMPIGSMRALYNVDPERAIIYAARDADAALRLYLKLKPELERLHLMKLMRDGMECLHVFEEMQSNGMPASRSYFRNLYQELTDQMHMIGSEISNTYYDGRPFNPNSTDQVATLMRRRGLKGTMTTPTGKVSTSKKSIEHLRHTDPAMKLVFNWREIEHVRDSFCSVILDAMPDDGEEDIYDIRCQIQITRTATRRLASRDPNFLAIPSRTEIGRKIRAGFMCRPGEVMSAHDLSQIESRVLADESGDKLLCELFNDPTRDIHKETAARVFGVPLDQVTKDQRTSAKTINYGIIYGLQAPGLEAQLRMLGVKDWDERKCQKAIRDWFTVYGGVSSYAKKVEDDTRKSGVVHDMWGMPRYLPGIYSQDRKIAAEAGRHAVSHKVQGGAQGLLQNSIRWLRPIIKGMQKAGLNVKWRLQIHDEILLSFSEDLWDTIDPLIMEALTQHCGVKLKVPVEASGHFATNWGELK